MFSKILLVIFITISSSFATTLDEMVKNALAKNQDLKSLQNSIKVTNQQIKISTKWQNPILSIGVNDIHFDKPFKRDLEAMQAEFIGFSQVIPTSNKLELQEQIALKDRQIAKYILKDKKLYLKSKIFELSYSIAILEKKYKLLNKYQKNIKKLIALTKVLYENKKANQSDIMKIEISYQKLSLQKESLKNLISNLYLKLQEITYTKIKKVEVPLKFQKLSLKANFKNHPKILLLKEKIKRFQTVSRLERAKKIPDLKLNIAYFQRDSKYKDYASISISAPLSIYKREDINALKARFQANEAKSTLKNTIFQFKSELLLLQNDLNSTKKRYQIIKHNILPLNKQIQKDLEAYNSLNQINPKRMIQNLNELFDYEIMLLDEMKSYFLTYSKAIYYIQGKIR